MVYDIKRRESFEALKEYWYEELKSSGEENIVFGLAGNKCDLFQKEQVTEEEGKKFAKEINAVFQLTSCKESVGIDELFEQCGKKYLEMNKLIESKENGKVVLDKDNTNKNVEGKKRRC